MKILQLVHTPLQYDPPVFNLGRQLQKQGHHIVMVGYWLPQLESYETIAPGYEIIRIDRGDWGFLPRLLRGGLRFLKYSLKAKAIYSQFNPDLVIATNFDSLSLGHLLKNKDVPIVYYCNEYSNKPDFRY
jgi:UDP-N-acetylglucosamine:LPS N-acetylglucosamine transferase